MAGKNRFGEIAAALPGKAHAHLDAYQAFLLDLSQQLTPKDEHDLVNSGAAAPGDDEFSRKVVYTAAHAEHQEFGTVFQPGTPFMRSSAAELQGPFSKDARKLMEP
jgi:hypothetical protein